MSGLKRFLVIFISITLSFLLQNIVLPKIPDLIAVPNLMLITVLSTGFLFGKAYGLLSGVICGLLLDILGNGIPGFYTLILSLLGYGDGVLSEHMDSELIPVLYVLLLLNELLYHVYVFIFAFLVRRSYALWSYVRKILVPEVLLTMVCFLLVYGLLIYIARKWDLKVNKGEVKVV